MKAFGAYQDFAAKRRKLKIPVKLRHSWLPVIFMMVCIYRNQNVTALTLLEVLAGLAIAFLSMLPLFLWAAQREREPPAFQCFSAIHFPYFAYPILNTRPEYMSYSETTRLIADATVVLYLALAIGAYYYRRPNAAKVRTMLFIPYRVIPERTIKQLGFVLLVIWFLFTVGYRFGFIDSLGSLRGVTNVVVVVGNAAGMISSWLLFRQLGEGRLSTGEKLFLGVFVGMTLTVSFAATTLVYGMCNLVICLVAYTQGRSKVPWIVIAAGITFLAFMNLGKADVRKTYGPGSTLSVSRIFDIYELWIDCSMRMIYEPERRIRDQRDVLSRANLIHIHTRAVDVTPSVKPFLYGETYAHLPQLLVPRLIWKDKPHVHISTERLGLYYGLTNAASIKTTTVGIGPITEAWANLGWLGVILAGIGMGAAMRTVATACLGAAPSSLHSIGSVIWVGMSFQIEQPFSGWCAAFATSLVGMWVCLYPLSRPARMPEPTMQHAMPAPA
ncbi:MAG TPA: hypothetical protein VHZ24_21730 [Pirellulales bacterium]|jgi:hypothetical protein|nr:hypothetical protein [Pirellulales bacterium]